MTMPNTLAALRKAENEARFRASHWCAQPDDLDAYRDAVAARVRAECAALVLDDRAAITFQTMGQYRTALAQLMRQPPALPLLGG